MNNRDVIQEHELDGSESILLPICFCLDTSGSMLRRDGGIDPVTLDRIGPSRLDMLKEGVETFIKGIYADETARYTVELALVTFDDSARMLNNFTLVERTRFDRSGRIVETIMTHFPELESRGNRTVMGEGLNLALDMLERCKKDYKNYGVDYYQPWLVLITDGINNGAEEAYAQAKERIGQQVKDNKLALYPIAIGTEQGRRNLDELSPNQPAINLDAADLPKLFSFLSSSAVKVSCSTTGTPPPKLEVKQVFSWSRSLDEF